MGCLNLGHHCRQARMVRDIQQHAMGPVRQGREGLQIGFPAQRADDAVAGRQGFPRQGIARPLLTPVMKRVLCSFMVPLPSLEAAMLAPVSGAPTAGSSGCLA